MHMLDCLPSLRAGIEDNPVSRLVDSGRHGDLVRLGCDLFQQASARPGQFGTRTAGVSPAAMLQKRQSLIQRS